MTGPERIVSSGLWQVVAAVFTPAHLLMQRAGRDQINAIFGGEPDPNDRIRWFEVLTLGIVKRRPVYPSMSLASPDAERRSD